MDENIYGLVTVLKNSNKVLLMLPKDDMSKIYLKINTKTCSDKEKEV